MHAVTRLIKRCYCYRDGIRDELESSIAYVADAGTKSYTQEKLPL